MLIVQKYGGSSVADKEKIYNAADRISAEYKSGNQIVVVVSAQGDTTDDLLDAAAGINPDASKRELDMLLSTGEQQSASLMAMALNAMGYPAVSLNAWQAGVFTTNEYGNARIRAIECERIRTELSKGKIVVVAGFQGINEYGDITTLGRGGSDTTAVALAAALNADKCEIYTDVEGVFTADPRVVENAVKLESISYEEMLNYTSMGAKVLHNRSVEYGKNSGVKIVVRSSFSNNKGTAVEGGAEDKTRPVSGIASDKNTALIRIAGRNTEVFSVMAEYNIPVDMIACSENTEFTVSAENLKKTLKVLKNSAHTSNEYSKVSIIGTGIQTNPVILADVLKCLADENINVEMINLSETKISILVNKNDNDKATRALHKILIEK
ncbi:MAG: aspartate kinase [Candidatus Metalachnospira sp.]|nr:aspartate kinase [Candidatus Metalachnospira sp.]